jgi:hypothetical protein
MPHARGILGTANRVTPSASPSLPAVRAATIRASAEAPWTTKSLRPERRKPLPAFSARQAMRSGRCLGPSSIATASTVSPAITPGSQRPRSSSDPADSAVTPMTAVVRNGEGVRLRPISVSTMPASTWPIASPPSASAARMPVRPSSANCFHSAWPNPSGQLMSRQWRSCCLIPPSSAMKPVTVSASIA